MENDAKIIAESLNSEDVIYQDSQGYYLQPYNGKPTRLTDDEVEALRSNTRDWLFH